MLSGDGVSVLLCCGGWLAGLLFIQSVGEEEKWCLLMTESMLMLEGDAERNAVAQE